MIYVLEGQGKQTAADFHSNAAWLCEIVYKSSDAQQPRIRLTTSMIRHKKADKVSVLIRDPSISRPLWSQQFVDRYLAQNPNADDLDIVLENPSAWANSAQAG